MVKYVGRYIRHPAATESRIISYNGQEVVFWYEDDDKIKHYVTMSVDEFIHAVIDHVPDKQFKTIRHDGVYSRGIKRKFKRLLGVVSIAIAQTKLTHFSGKWAPKCPNCSEKMEFALTWKCKPLPKWNFGEGISDWNYILSSGNHR